MPPAEIAVATPAEVDLLVEWAAREGWNPGLADAAPFRAADPHGFFVARLDGEAVAGISVVNHDDSFAFLGFYICAPAHRGHGHGIAVWRAGLAHAGTRTVGLDGVVAQEENYRRSGFALHHRDIRFGGSVAAATASAGTVAVGPDLVEPLVAWDAPRSGATRTAFLRPWLDGRGGRCARAVVEDGRLRGYGVIRPCREGHKIGPLFAEDEAAAERLFADLVRAVGGGLVFVDAPEPNAAAVALLRRHGLAPVFETARMYRGPAPDLPLSEVYGVTTLELG